MKKHLEIAIGQLGVHEDPKKANWGPQVEQYLLSIGLKQAASWCMAFVFWCSREAYGVNNKLIKTGGVLRQWQSVDTKYKFTKDPQPGDIFIMDYGKGLGHTGIIESVVGNLLHTIEGNTNDEGSREGYEVCRRTRKFPDSKSKIVGFIRLP